MQYMYIYFQEDNKVNEALMKAINDDRRIHMVPSIIRGVYFLRFAICASRTTSEDVKYAWKVIQEIAKKILEKSETDFSCTNGI